MNEQQPQPHESLVRGSRDPLIRILNKIVVCAVKILAVMMVLVIVWALADVIVHLFRQMTASFASAFNVENLIGLLGAFLAVLVAIEIFLNIIFYLQKDAIHVPLVLATALTAVSRKVIVLDYTTATPIAILAIAAVIFALGISYWLIVKQENVIT